MQTAPLRVSARTDLCRGELQLGLRLGPICRGVADATAATVSLSGTSYLTTEQVLAGQGRCGGKVGGHRREVGKSLRSLANVVLT